MVDASHWQSPLHEDRVFGATMYTMYLLSLVTFIASVQAVPHHHRVHVHTPPAPNSTEGGRYPHIAMSRGPDGRLHCGEACQVAGRVDICSCFCGWEGCAPDTTLYPVGEQISAPS